MNVFTVLQSCETKDKTETSVYGICFFDVIWFFWFFDLMKFSSSLPNAIPTPLTTGGPIGNVISAFSEKSKFDLI